MIALALAASVATDAAGRDRCYAPMTVTLSPRAAVAVDIVFACASADRATIRWRSDDRCSMLTGDYVRGSAQVNRDGTTIFRLIDRAERANDLSYRDGHLQISRGGRIVATARPGRRRCA